MSAKRRRKAECTPEEWEAYKAYQRNWYHRQTPEKRAGIVARAASYASRHPEYRRDEHYRRKYGISLADYNRMLAEQGHRCALCRKHESEVWVKRPFGKERRDGRLVVDHCHESGSVRGLLCDSCNTLLGVVQDDADLLCRIAEYVSAHKPALRIA